MSDYPVINGLIFCGLGIIVFVIAFALVVKLSPLDLWKQVGEERNIAEIGRAHVGTPVT